MGSIGSVEPNSFGEKSLELLISGHSSGHDVDGSTFIGTNDPNSLAFSLTCNRYPLLRS